MRLELLSSPGRVRRKYARDYGKYSLDKSTGIVEVAEVKDYGSLIPNSKVVNSKTSYTCKLDIVLAGSSSTLQ